MNAGMTAITESPADANAVMISALMLFTGVGLGHAERSFGARASPITSFFFLQHNHWLGTINVIHY